MSSVAFLNRQVAAEYEPEESFASGSLDTDLSGDRDEGGPAGFGDEDSLIADGELDGSESPRLDGAADADVEGFSETEAETPENVHGSALLDRESGREFAQPLPSHRVSPDMTTMALPQRVYAAGPSDVSSTSFVSDYSQLDDAVIMIRVRDGDFAGYEYLVQKYRRPVMHFLFRMVHNQAIAEELAQEVFLRVFRARATYRAEARFTTWMYRIATNLAVNHARDNRHDSPAANVYLDEIDGETGTRPDVADETPSVEYDLVKQERFRAIRAEVNALPDRQRTAVLMHKFQGLDYREIGRVLKLSESATKSLLFRAYQTLRDKLKDFA